MYKLTRELKDSKIGSSPQIYLQNGRPVRKPELMANLQPNYYVDKLKEIMTNIPISQRNPHRVLDRAIENWDDSGNIPTFEFREVTLVETHKFIMTMSDSTASGHDGLDPLGIKTAVTQLIHPLQHLINSSLNKSTFPRKWKFSKLTPIYKGKGCSRSDTSSYRPVAVLSTVSKLVERAAQKQLLDFFDKSKQLNPSNHAYRSNHSTTTTLLEISDELHQGTEDNKMASIMALDQTSAFDCVLHRLLLEKLEWYHIGKNACTWIKDYLNERTQYVVVGATRSRMVPVSSGVPQGSVIGPLLYTIYTNDLTNVVKSPVCRDVSHFDRTSLFGHQCSNCGILTIYADDTTYTVTSKTRQSNTMNMRRCLDEINLFLQDNFLVINQPKTSITECMLGQKRGKTPGPPQPVSNQGTRSHKTCTRFRIQ